MSRSLLCTHAQCGNAEEVDIMLDAGAILDVVDQRGFSPLMCAAECPHGTAAAAILIEAGASVNYAAPDSGLTPLLVACKEGNAATVLLLLRNGADPMRADVLARSALHWAAMSPSVKCLRMIVKVTKKALLDAQDASGYTPLMTAAEYNRVDAVRYLLAQGAKTDTQNRLTHSACELADWYGFKLILQELVKT